MTQFKVGAFVRMYNKTTGQYNTIKRIVKESSFGKNDIRYSVDGSLFYSPRSGVFNLWQPEEGEWCWFKEAIEDQYVNTGAYVFAQFEGFANRIIDLGYKKEHTVVTTFTASVGLTYYNSAGLDCAYDFLYCEPFIGQLPSWVKEK